MNPVPQLAKKLKVKHYVRKADPSGNYWLDFSYRELQAKQEVSGDNFYLVVHGHPKKDNDFFIIPFRAVKHVLVKKNLADAKEGDKRKRWIASIHNRQLRVHHSDEEVSLHHFYGNRHLLELAVGEPAKYLPSEESDQPESEPLAPYAPGSEDRRPTVMRQIKERRGQQGFRDDLRERYGDRCMISGCELMDVVEAAHIKPYREPNDHNAENGLLLRADLHTLFDLDLIGIEPTTLKVHLHPSMRLAGYETYDGVLLRCSTAKPSPDALSIRWADYHARLARKAK